MQIIPVKISAPQLKNRSRRFILCSIVALALAGCTPALAVEPTIIDAHPSATGTSSASSGTATRRPASTATANHPSSTAVLSRTPTQRAATPATQPVKTSSPTVTPTLAPDGWKQLPIIPDPSDRILEIYQRGLELGNNPYAFSKVGDCGSTPSWFLGDFDRGDAFYDLGEYGYLQSLILFYPGSFERTSQAARSGFNVSSLLTTLWTDLNHCMLTETPLECEYRLHRPVVAFVTLGTNDIWRPEQFEPGMREIIEFSIERGVIPILSTKADNEEGDGSINAKIAALALEYDLPLWNYWLAIQSLPNHGLQEDGVHLTFGRNFFDNPADLSKAWTIRNLTALQALNQVWLKVTGQID